MKLTCPMLPVGSILIEPDIFVLEEMAMVNALQITLDQPEVATQIGYLQSPKSMMILVGIGDLADIQQKMNAVANVVSLAGCQVDRQNAKPDRKANQN